jgi:hypothetical protein
MILLRRHETARRGQPVKCIVLAHDLMRNVDRWAFEEES